MRVNAIFPGFVHDTDFRYYLNQTFGDVNEFEVTSDNAIAKSDSLHNDSLADDCVRAISFVTKESASFLTGVILRVDGGVSIKSVV